MNIHKLSKQYNVKRLSEDDIDLIYDLSVGNPMYYKYCPPFVTKDSIKNDMHALPPGKNKSDKLYIGYFDGVKLIAILDLIVNYPKEKTAWIGLFMMDNQYQGRGIGTALIEECCMYLKELGFVYVSLGYVKGNPQSEAFWLKNKFINTGRESKQDEYTVVIMQRKLL